MPEIMKNEKVSPSSFDGEKFRAGFVQHLAEWKSKWTTPDSGPITVGVTYHMMNEAQREADRPELEARYQLIQYCARTIQGAEKTEDRVEAVSLIQRSLGENLLHREAAHELLVDIFKATVVQLGGKD